MHGPSSQESPAPVALSVPISASLLLPCVSPSFIMPCSSVRSRILEDVWASDRHKISLELQGLTHASNSKLQAKVMRNVVPSVIPVPTRSRLGYAEFHLERNSGHKGTPQQDNGQHRLSHNDSRAWLWFISTTEGEKNSCLPQHRYNSGYQKRI